MKKMALGVTGGKRLSAYGWLAVFMFVFFTTQTLSLIHITQQLNLLLSAGDDSIDVFYVRDLATTIANGQAMDITELIEMCIRDSRIRVLNFLLYLVYVDKELPE